MESPSWKKYPPHVNADETLMLILTVEKLTPFELALFMRIYEAELLYGQCKKNTRTLAEESNMSEKSVIKAKKGLVRKWLITIKKEKSALNGRPMDVINTYVVVDELFKRINV